MPSADVVVIGAGLSGLSAAIELAENGATGPPHRQGNGRNALGARWAGRRRPGRGHHVHEWRGCPPVRSRAIRMPCCTRPSAGRHGPPRPGCGAGSLSRRSGGRSVASRPRWAGCARLPSCLRPGRRPGGMGAGRRALPAGDRSVPRCLAGIRHPEPGRPGLARGPARIESGTVEASRAGGAPQPQRPHVSPVGSTARPGASARSTRCARPCRRAALADRPARRPRARIATAGARPDGRSPGHPVFEIPTLPAVGSRTSSLRGAAGSALGPGRGRPDRLSRRALVREGPRVTAVETHAAARPLRIRTGAVVLATGGIAGGGFRGARDGEVNDMFAGLPVSAPVAAPGSMATCTGRTAFPLNRRGSRRRRAAAHWSRRGGRLRTCAWLGVRWPGCAIWRSAAATGLRSPARCTPRGPSRMPSADEVPRPRRRRELHRRRRSATRLLHRPLHQVQCLHHGLPGRAGDRPVPRPQVCRPAGPAIPRPARGR